MKNYNDVLVVIVLNANEPGDELITAAAKMAAGLIHRLNPQNAGFIDFVDGDGMIHHRVSSLPIQIKAAEGSESIRQLRRAALRTHGVLTTDFVRSMDENIIRGTPYETALPHDSQLEYRGLCLAGRTDVIEDLTRQFRSWTRAVQPRGSLVVNWP